MLINPDGHCARAVLEKFLPTSYVDSILSDAQQNHHNFDYVTDSSGFWSQDDVAYILKKANVSLVLKVFRAPEQSQCRIGAEAGRDRGPLLHDGLNHYDYAKPSAATRGAAPAPTTEEATMERAAPAPAPAAEEATTPCLAQECGSGPPLLGLLKRDISKL